MRFKADFHMHVKGDLTDTFITHSAEDLIRYAAERKFEVLSITNHNMIHYNERLKEFALSLGILLLPGVEATIEGRHVLLINYQGPLPIRKLTDLKSLYNSPTLIIGAHPFYPTSFTLRGKLVQHIDCFHAIEYCHFYPWFFNVFNHRAEAVGATFHKPMVGTSDSHYLIQMNHTYSWVEAETKTPDAIISAIKKGLVYVETKPLPLTTIARIAKIFFY